MMFTSNPLESLMQQKPCFEPEELPINFTKFPQCKGCPYHNTRCDSIVCGYSQTQQIGQE